MKVQLDNPAILTRMRRVCKVDKDADLARYLDETTSAVSSWKNATYPPFNACYTVAQKTGVSMEWLLTGNDSVSQIKQPSTANETSRELFIDKFLEAIRLGIRMGLLSVDSDGTDKELQRLGFLLFNESLGATKSPKIKSSQEEQESTETELED